MPGLKISPAAPEDALAVAQLHVSSWQVAHASLVQQDRLDSLSVTARESLWRELIVRGTPELLLAWEDATAVGFVSFGKSRDPGAADTVGEIWAIYVLPSHWSRGVGRDLWLHARERLRSQGFHSVTLWVLAENARAIRFYTRAGFVPEQGSTQELVRGDKTLQEVRYHAALT
jgi:ribosomal protein S18 acetylase RimI-like enzyme